MTADTLNRPLTESERALVTQYHNLIYRVIEDYYLPNDAAADAYGEAALGLILVMCRAKNCRNTAFLRLHSAVCARNCGVSVAKFSVNRLCLAWMQS